MSLAAMIPLPWTMVMIVALDMDVVDMVAVVAMSPLPAATIEDTWDLRLVSLPPVAPITDPIDINMAATVVANLL